MIVKATVYFNLIVEEDAKISNLPLLLDILNDKLEEHLRDSSFKLEGSWWDDNRILGHSLTKAEALELLRTKK